MGHFRKGYKRTAALMVYFHGIIIGLLSLSDCQARLLHTAPLRHSKLDKNPAAPRLNDARFSNPSSVPCSQHPHLCRNGGICRDNQCHCPMTTRGMFLGQTCELRTECGNMQRQLKSDEECDFEFSTFTQHGGSVICPQKSALAGWNRANLTGNLALVYCKAFIGDQCIQTFIKGREYKAPSLACDWARSCSLAAEKHSWKSGLLFAKGIRQVVQGNPNSIEFYCCAAKGTVKVQQCSVNATAIRGEGFGLAVFKASYKGMVINVHEALHIFKTVGLEEDAMQIQLCVVDQQSLDECRYSPIIKRQIRSTRIVKPGRERKLYALKHIYLGGQKVSARTKFKDDLRMGLDKTLSMGYFVDTESNEKELFENTGSAVLNDPLKFKMIDPVPYDGEEEMAVQDMFTDTDSDGNGLINYYEFSSIFHKELRKALKDFVKQKKRR